MVVSLPKKRKTILLFGTEIEIDPSDDEIGFNIPEKEGQSKCLADEDDDLALCTEFLDLKKNTKSTRARVLEQSKEQYVDKMHKSHGFRWKQSYKQLVKFISKKCKSNPGIERTDFKRLFEGSTDEDAFLKAWLNKQVILHKDKLLSSKQTRKLTKIGFNFKQIRAPPKFTWDEKYSKFKAFYDKHHTTRIPSDHPDGPELTHWLTNQHYNYRNTGLGEEKRKKLAALGVEWAKHPKKKQKTKEDETHKGSSSDSS